MALTYRETWVQIFDSNIQVFMTFEHVHHFHFPFQTMQVHFSAYNLTKGQNPPNHSHLKQEHYLEDKTRIWF